MTLRRRATRLAPRIFGTGRTRASSAGPGPNGIATPSRLAASPAGDGHGGLRWLADLTGIATAGRDLDRTLQSSARLIREATNASAASIWQLREDELVRRAADGPVAGSPTILRASSGVLGRAIRTRRAAIEMPLGTRDWRNGAWHGPIEVALPIVEEGSTWGALVLRSTHRTDGESWRVEWMTAAAAVLAATIRSAELLTEAGEAVHRAEALRRVATDVNGTLDIDETLSRLLDHATVLFGADRGAVFVLHSGGNVTAEVSRALSATYIASVARFPNPSLGADAVEARRTLFATNYRDDPRCAEFRAAVVQEGFDTLCCAPLIDASGTVGLLNLYHDQVKHWTDAELETMAAFASYATVAIRSAQQYGQLERWAAQLQSIQQLASRLNRLATPTEIATAIATEINQLIEHDNVRVYRLEGEELIVVALQAHDDEYVDETPDQVRSRVGQGITGWVAAHGVAQNLPDAAHDPRATQVPGTTSLDESLLLAPMIFEGRVLGVLVLSRRGLGRFDDDDLRLLEIYASLAAQAMANAETADRLREQSAALERQLRSQRELLHITELIISTLDSRAVLDQIADRLGRLVRYDGIAIEVYDRATDTLLPVTERGADGRDAPGPRALSENPLVAMAIERNEPMLVANDETDANDGRARAGSRIVAPLRGRDAVTGVLSLARSEPGDRFTSEEFDLVLLFAGQVSIALQNAETHRAVEVRARTDDMTGLLNYGSLREWLVKSAAVAEPFSLIMLDLDEFKAINDAFGHPAGDGLLSQIARAIVGAGRDTDLVFRYGGDEFAILLPRTDAEGAMHLADRIRKAVHRVHRPGHRPAGALEITASIGVATFPTDGATAEAILLAADRACFVAKRAGRDRIAAAPEGMALVAEFSLQEPTPVDPPSLTAA